MTDELLHAELTQSVIGAFYEVYNTFKHGLLESLYLAALERELRARGHRVARECAVRVMYKGEEIGWQRLDMVVDDVLIVEAKSTSVLHESAARQLYTYLRVTNLEVGLLLHFGPKAQFFRLVYENRLKSREA
jgi:GxxExxY protein